MRKAFDNILDCDCDDDSMCNSGQKCKMCKCIGLRKSQQMNDSHISTLNICKYLIVDAFPVCNCAHDGDGMCAEDEVCKHCYCLPKGIKIFF